MGQASNRGRFYRITKEKFVFVCTCPTCAKSIVDPNFKPPFRRSYITQDNVEKYKLVEIFESDSHDHPDVQLVLDANRFISPDHHLPGPIAFYLPRVSKIREHLREQLSICHDFKVPIIARLPTERDLLDFTIAKLAENMSTKGRTTDPTKSRVKQKRSSAGQSVVSTTMPKGKSGRNAPPALMVPTLSPTGQQSAPPAQDPPTMTRNDVIKWIIDQISSILAEETIAGATKTCLKKGRTELRKMFTHTDNSPDDGDSSAQEAKLAAARETLKTIRFLDCHMLDKTVDDSEKDDVIKEISGFIQELVHGKLKEDDMHDT